MAILDFVKPDKVIISEISNYNGVFHLKPLEPGYGITLGNALRRVLLSSLKGFAVTSIRIKGVKYEFSTIEGIVEDVTEIILNFKKIRLKKITPDITKETVNASICNCKLITGKILNNFISGFKILNDDLIICRKENSTPLDIQFTIESGKGYVSAKKNNNKNEEDISNVIGNIPIDAIYTPIINVKYSIENCRVEQKTDFENLVLEIKTDGSISPKKALMEASNILIQYFSIFSSEKISKRKNEKLDKNKQYNEEYIKMKNLLKSKLNDMDLSVRTKNCLRSVSINTIYDLVNLDKDTILKIRNFGKKSLEELEKKMKDKGLSFGMKISENLKR